MQNLQSQYDTTNYYDITNLKCIQIKFHFEVNRAHFKI